MKTTAEIVDEYAITRGPDYGSTESWDGDSLLAAAELAVEAERARRAEADKGYLVLRVTEDTAQESIEYIEEVFGLEGY